MTRSVLLRFLLTFALVLSGTLPAQAALQHERQLQASPLVAMTTKGMHCHHGSHAGHGVTMAPFSHVPAHHAACCAQGVCHCPAMLSLSLSSLLLSLHGGHVQQALPPLLPYASLHPSLILRPPIA